MLSSITFASPFLLVALVLLPAIWWLLRVTPPSPRRVVFPPLRLLLGLTAQEETPARTPWWLLLLRMIVAALVIVALSEPTIGQRPAALSTGPLILFVDNGWPAAHAWDAREAAMDDAISAAQQARRAIAIIPTASAVAPDTGLVDAGKALRIMRDLAPQSWIPNRTRALEQLAKARFSSRPEILWLSDGLDYGDAKATRDGLSRIGTLRVFMDAPGKGPLGLKPEEQDADGFSVRIVRAGVEGVRKGRVEAIGDRGQYLAGADFRIDAGRNETRSKLGMPLEVRNQTEYLAIADENSAGAMRLMDSAARRHAVGLVSNETEESEQPLSDIYYLERALAPYAELRKGSIAELLDHGVDALVLADIGKLSGDEYDRVARFVNDGGLLVRFAGARLAAGVDDLIPVRLRTGARYIGTGLSWGEPQHLAAFGDASPFRGIAVPHEVTVTTQVLAEPSIELSQHSWARLTDGTPLVTAARRGKGWIVLYHVTAGPLWSSLPLSGLYVEMLRRTISLAGGALPSDLAMGGRASFPPVATLDGFGRSHSPPADVLPIRGGELGKVPVSPRHPAGLYGNEGSAYALNVMHREDTLLPITNLGVSLQYYSGSRSLALQPWLLACAFVLLLLDALISLGLRGYALDPRRLLRRSAMVLALFLLLPPGISRADDEFDKKAALDTRLAYVITGVADVDEVSRQGLSGLSLMLRARTSYQAEPPMGVNLETDDLAFFPLLYWPMDPRQKDLSPQAISKVSEFMRNGGTILIDTRDLTLGETRGPNSPGQQTLKRLLAKIDIPPLQPVPADHVLTKAFYLLSTFPGRWDGGTVWVEKLPPADPRGGPAPARGGDGVSPVIIGGNDWASAWAVNSSGQMLNAVVPGGEQQREMAFRFGINVVMYAFTGNYKTDQVHVPALLERLKK